MQYPSRPVSIQRIQEHLQRVGPFPLGCEAVRHLLTFICRCSICSRNIPWQWSKWVRQHFLHIHLSMLCYDDHTILANKHPSALATAAVTVGLIVLDVGRFPNGCKVDPGNGANKSISFDFSLFSAKLTKAELPCSLQ